jgi:hypothetical protein
MAKKSRAVCPRCNRDVAVVGKRGQLAKHKCKPTLETALAEAEQHERAVRRYMLENRRVAVQARAWTFRLLALMLLLSIADVLIYVVLGAGVLWIEAVSLTILALVAGKNHGRWRRAESRARMHAEHHPAAVLDVEKAQQAINRAAMPELYGPATDLDNLE